MSDFISSLLVTRRLDGWIVWKLRFKEKLCLLKVKFFFGEMASSENKIDGYRAGTIDC